MRAAKIHRNPARTDVGDAGEGVTHRPSAAVVIPALHPAFARERVVRDIRGGEIVVERERIRAAAGAGAQNTAGVAGTAGVRGFSRCRAWICWC